MDLGTYILERKHKLLLEIHDDYKDFVRDYLEKVNDNEIEEDFYEFTMSYDFSMNELIEWLNNDLENNINYIDLAMRDSDLRTFHSLLLQARIIQISDYLDENKGTILMLIFLQLLWNLEDEILEKELTLNEIEKLEHFMEYNIFSFCDLEELREKVFTE